MADHRSAARHPQILSELPDEAIVAASEAAVLMGRSTETLRRWRCKGLGPNYLRAVARPDFAEYQIGDVRCWVEQRKVVVGRATAPAGGISK